MQSATLDTIIDSTRPAMQTTTPKLPDVDISKLRDSKGRPFDPAIHCTNPDGTPKLNRVSRTIKIQPANIFRKAEFYEKTENEKPENEKPENPEIARPGAEPGIDAVTENAEAHGADPRGDDGSPGPWIDFEATDAQASEPEQPAQAQEPAKPEGIPAAPMISQAIAKMYFAIGSRLSGGHPAAQPLKIEALDYDEEREMIQAWTAYLRSKGVDEMTPGWGIVLVSSVYLGRCMALRLDSSHKDPEQAKESAGVQEPDS